MNNFAKAFGKKFDADSVRVRSFELNGNTFKVRIPLTAESEQMGERLKKADDDLVEKYYAELSKNFLENKSEFEKEKGIEYKDNDIIIQGRSIREAASNKALTEMRIVEMMKLLVPEEKEFDMATITYDMIDELFPFPVQIQMLELISETISPTYEKNKGK